MVGIRSQQHLYAADQRPFDCSPQGEALGQGESGIRKSEGGWGPSMAAYKGIADEASFWGVEEVDKKVVKDISKRFIYALKSPSSTI